MSDRFRLVLFIMVLVYFVVAVRLIHRKRLSLNYSLLWMFMLLIMLIMVMFPQLIYSLAGLVGIDLPINMIFTGFAFLTLIMLFKLTCIVSRDNEKNRALTQQLDLLEKRVRELVSQVKNEKKD